MSLSFRNLQPQSRGQNHDGLDSSCLRRVLRCSVDLIERVSTNESVEWQTALPVQVDEPWNELSRVAASGSLSPPRTGTVAYSAAALTNASTRRAFSVGHSSDQG